MTRRFHQWMAAVTLGLPTRFQTISVHDRAQWPIGCKAGAIEYLSDPRRSTWVSSLYAGFDLATERRAEQPVADAYDLVLQTGW